MSKKPQQKNPARNRSQGCCDPGIRGVDDVAIVEVKKEEPHPGYFIYKFRVRAQVTLPASDCTLTGSPEAKVYKTGSSDPIATALMSLESGSKVWYTTSQLSATGCHPGDTLHATVTARWVCPGSDAKDSAPTTLP